jgi:hypothetical protein
MEPSVSWGVSKRFSRTVEAEEGESQSFPWQIEIFRPEFFRLGAQLEVNLEQ